jgi:hypothetical protein
MKGTGLLLYGILLLLPVTSRAGGSSSISFRDAFRAYVKMRQLEEKSRIADRRHDIEEGARLELKSKLTSDLTEARIDFQAFLMPGEKGLSDWERQTLRKVGGAKDASPDKAGLDFLSSAYAAKAARWTPLEWQCAAEWFGHPTADAFLKSVFAMDELPADAPAPNGKRTVVWVADPLQRFMAKDQASKVTAGRASLRNQLEKQGYVVEDLEVGAFTRLDEQAEDLHLALAQKITDGTPFTLVSSGYASALLLRTLDLNPGLLSSNVIEGWVNVNGQLFGGDDEALSRGPATASRADRQLHDTRHELLLLREERLGPQTPLGAKFPVLNLVTFSGAHRPGANLRDSILPDGRTVYIPSGDGEAHLRRALPALGRHAPSGQRDSSDDSDL